MDLSKLNKREYHFNISDFLFTFINNNSSYNVTYVMYDGNNNNIVMVIPQSYLNMIVWSHRTNEIGIYELSHIMKSDSICYILTQDWININYDQFSDHHNIILDKTLISIRKQKIKNLK